jgi:hypothetical protein
MHVRGLAARPALDHLGGQIARGAHEHPGHGQPGGIRTLCDPEVDHHGRVLEQHHVARFDVAVDHPGGVHRDKGIGEPAGQPGQRRPAQRAVLRHHVVQGAAGHEPGHDVRHAPDEVGVDHLGHVRAAHPLHRLDLTGEPPPRRRIARHAGTQDLERDRPVTVVTGKEDNPHAALADPVEQAVFPKPFRHQVLIVHGMSQTNYGAPFRIPVRIGQCGRRVMS